MAENLGLKNPVGQRIRNGWQKFTVIGVIRKVLGASVSCITVMLSKDFMKLVIISIIIASSIAYWSYDKMVAGFCLSHFT